MVGWSSSVFFGVVFAEGRDGSRATAWVLGIAFFRFFFSVEAEAIFLFLLLC